MPEEWCIGIICPLHKKGHQLNCKNYRGITLLNTMYKILPNIIYNRLSTYNKTILGDYQSGFRLGCSTIDQIFNINTYHTFIVHIMACADDVDMMTALQKIKESFTLLSGAAEKSGLTVNVQKNQSN